MITDERLMSNYLAGSVSAFEELYRRNRPRVFDLAMRHIHNTSAAEQITQQVFRKFHKLRRKYDSQYTVTQFLFVVTRREIIQHLKRVGQIPVPESPSDILSTPSTSDFKSELKRQSDLLDAHKMVTLKEKFIDGLAIEEIAARIGWALHAEWLPDWQHFHKPIEREEVALFGSLRLRVQADLYPPTFGILTRVLIYYLLGGSCALLICPQLDVQLSEFEGLQPLLLKLGPNIGNFLSAFFFESVALWTVGLCLTPVQLTTVASRRASLICLLIALAFSILLVIHSHPLNTAAFVWLAGAVIAAIAQANMLFPISQR